MEKKEIENISNSLSSNENSMSTSSFAAISLGSFGTGILLGAAYVIKSENQIYSFRKNPAPFYLASRALIISSACSVGFFAAGNHKSIPI